MIEWDIMLTGENNFDTDIITDSDSDLFLYNIKFINTS